MVFAGLFYVELITCFDEYVCYASNCRFYIVKDSVSGGLDRKSVV